MVTLKSDMPVDETLLTNDEMLSRIGQVTRTLHDNLRLLGFDKILEQVATEIPDARDRLNYVARMTEQAAERVLNSIDLANPLQDEITNSSVQIEKEWHKVIDASDLNLNQTELVNKTLNFIKIANKNSVATKALLIDIMMAQDFQDLTGQVINRITLLAHDLERELVQVLIDFSPASANKENDSKLINGPQINPEQSDDALSSQSQVDNLLDTLGF
jgi:chemotaxis protein CheZ